MHRRNFKLFEDVIKVKKARIPAGTSVDGVAYGMEIPQVEETNLQSKEVPTSVTKGSSLLESGTRLFATVMFIAFGWTVMPLIAATTSYFSDTEGSMGVFASGTLDLITNFTATSTNLSCGDYTQFDVGVRGASSSLPFVYTVSAEKTGGSDEFCESLDLTAWLDGNEVYEGDLLDFENGEETVPSDWEFKVKFPLDIEGIPAGSQCLVDLVFVAEGDFGYTDSERVPINVTKTGDCGTDEECDDPTNPECPCFNGDVTVIVENNSSSTVTNTASSSVNTGGNSANGGAGGNGGSGGNGGNGGNGGYITTGNASSSINITNVINTSSTTVTTGCSGCCSGNCGCSGGGNCNHSSTTVTSSTNNSSSSNNSTSTAQSIKDKIQNTINNVFGNLGLGVQHFSSH